RRVFANSSAVADLDRRVLALVLEVLRIAAHHRADADLHIVAQRDVPLERRARGDRAVATHDAVLADDRERTDLRPVADARVGMNDRRWMNRHAHLSRTTAPISASQTSCPSTFATPDILHIMPRTCSSSSSKRS